MSFDILFLCAEKGNVKHQTQRNRLPLKQATSLKGNAKQGSRRKKLPLPRPNPLKGNVKHQTQRNRLPLKLATSLKGNVKGKFSKIGCF